MTGFSWVQTGAYPASSASLSLPPPTPPLSHGTGHDGRERKQVSCLLLFPLPLLPPFPLSSPYPISTPEAALGSRSPPSVKIGGRGPVRSFTLRYSLPRRLEAGMVVLALSPECVTGGLC